MTLNDIQHELNRIRRSEGVAPAEKHDLIIDSEGEIQGMHSDALMKALPQGVLTIARLSQVEPIVLDGKATWCVTTAKGELVLATGFTERAAALKWERENFYALVMANGIQEEFRPLGILREDKPQPYVHGISIEPITVEQVCRWFGVDLQAEAIDRPELRTAENMGHCALCGGPELACRARCVGDREA